MEKTIELQLTKILSKKNSYGFVMFEFFRRFSSVDVEKRPVETSTHSDSTDGVIEVKGDQYTNKVEAKDLNLSAFDIWTLALTTSIGGHYLTWNDGLSAGFGSYIIATFLIASAFVCLILCIAELSSALPFAGKK